MRHQWQKPNARIRGEVAPKPRFDLRKHPDYEAKMTTYPPVERP